MCWLNSPFLAKTPESVGPEDKMSCHASSRLDKFDKQGRLKIGEPKIQWLIMNIWTGFSLLSQKNVQGRQKKYWNFRHTQLVLVHVGSISQKISPLHPQSGWFTTPFLWLKPRQMAPQNWGVHFITGHHLKNLSVFQSQSQRLELALRAVGF